MCRSFKKKIKNADFLKIQAARMENSVSKKKTRTGKRVCVVAETYGLLEWG